MSQQNNIILLGKFEYRCLATNPSGQSNLDSLDQSNDDSENQSHIENINIDGQEENLIYFSQISDYSLEEDRYYVGQVQLSPNQQYIAFEIKKSDSNSEMYFHLIFNIQTQKLLYKDEQYYSKFMFTSDSKYIIYCQAYKIYLMELESIQNKLLIEENFAQLLTVDSNNNIYIQKNNYLYLYSIENKLTSSFILNESLKSQFIRQAYKLHSDFIFLVSQDSNYIINYSCNKILSKQRSLEGQCQNVIFQNQFLIEWDLEIDQINLSNLKNRKLIRKFKNNQEGSSSIFKNQNSIYKYFFFRDSENSHIDQSYIRINLLTNGKITSRLSLGKYKYLIYERIIMTDYLLIIIDSFKFRFFQYDLQQIGQI
ncbi:unnamed protein product [Paramecium sonneborni]|uniref:Uncharacterized protein n=1 Tax=Paramecium sonneborni TaxID=65129 RepID=A0A8S1PRK3_9CILI|nr:unnamed protein product [Paramecium sonneborni]